MKFVEIMQPLWEQAYSDDDVQQRRSKMRGRPLPETGYQYARVEIYRAVPMRVTTFEPMCYVTRSRKFANGHADHMAITEGEDYHVIRGVAKSSDVYEAPNAGEFFYDGATLRGQQTYVARED